MLAKYAAALRLADQAARRSRFTWERGPLTVQNLQDPTWLPLDEIQGLRELPTALSESLFKVQVSGSLGGQLDYRPEPVPILVEPLRRLMRLAAERK